MRNATRMGVVFALGTTTVLGACGGGSHASTDTAAMAATAAPAGGAMTTPAAGGSTSVAGTPGMGSPADSVHNPSSTVPSSTGRMTDPEILTLTQAADQGEIETSQLAATKATNADVRKFADHMRHDHAQMISQRTALIKSQDLHPAAGAKDSINTAGQKMLSMLKSTPKGMAFDTAYVNGQVMAHTNTLAMVQKAEGEAQNAALKTALTKAAGEVQGHLTEAKALQSKLEGGAR